MRLTIRLLAHNFRYPIFGGVIYESDMTNLLPGKTVYKYRVGGYDSNNVAHMSEEFVFKTPPLPNADEKTVFAMLGDQVFCSALFICFAAS